MGYSRDDVEMTRTKSRKYVSFLEGSQKYSIGITKFRIIAKRANAVQKISNTMLVNCELFEKYLEAYRIF